MANKKLRKITLDRECLLESLQLRNISIRRLGKDYDFGWSSKSVERGIKDGEVSPELMDALGKYLDVDTDYLSGKYHRDAEKIKDESVCLRLKSGLKADKFPYILKQQRIKYGGKFLYDRYLEYILIIHDISIHQFDALLFEKQKAFQLDLEDAIAKVLIKHFPYNAMGQEIWPAIYKVKNDIENYNPDEPEIREDFIMDENDGIDPFEEKYSNFQLIGGSDIENQK
ncbi:MAG: hypothetical protein JEZ00_13335 [Anaerolineaceae bacterium]|nr:hypothetical protein [Anaerolineaceae bacterium]